MLFGAACGDDEDDATHGTSMEPTTTAGSTDDATDTGSQTETGTSGDETGVGMVDYAADVQPIWNGNCTCHLQGPSGTMTATVLTLNPDISYGELVGVVSEQVPGMNRVTPGDLEQSYLWHKLQNTHLDVGGMGTSMPQGLMLNDEAMAVVEAWIAMGAEP